MPVSDRSRLERWAAVAGFVAVMVGSALCWRFDSWWWLLPGMLAIGAKALHSAVVEWRRGARADAVPSLLLVLAVLLSPLGLPSIAGPSPWLRLVPLLPVALGVGVLAYQNWADERRYRQERALRKAEFLAQVRR